MYLTPCGPVPLPRIPPSKGVGEETSLALERSLLDCTFRLQGRNNRTWVAELILANCPLNSTHSKEQGTQKRTHMDTQKTHKRTCVQTHTLPNCALISPCSVCVSSLYTPCVSDLWEPSVWACGREEGGGDVPQRLDLHQPALPVCPGVLTITTRDAVLPESVQWDPAV